LPVLSPFPNMISVFPRSPPLGFILGRMPREWQRISSDFAQARWDLRFLVIPSSVAPEE
jgi:hypothetical protein